MSLFVVVFAPVRVRVGVFACTGVYRSGLKQIKFVLHLLAHKAVELGLRVWVVDWCLQEDVGEQKQAHPTPVLRRRIYKSKYPKE